MAAGAPEDQAQERQGAFGVVYVMNCWACGIDGSAVTKTLDMGGYVLRMRACACGQKWRTKEVRFNPRGQPLVARKAGPLVARAVLETKIISDSDQNSVITQSVPSGIPIRARVGRPNSRSYGAEFERLWAGCVGKRGLKGRAFKIWSKLKPDVDVVIQRWSEWMQTGQFKYGAVPHLSSWLNDSGWEQSPTSDDLKPWSNGHRQESFQDAQARISRERAAEEAERRTKAESEAARILKRLEAK